MSDDPLSVRGVVLKYMGIVCEHTMRTPFPVCDGCVGHIEQALRDDLRPEYQSLLDVAMVERQGYRPFTEGWTEALQRRAPVGVDNDFRTTSCRNCGRQIGAYPMRNWRHTDTWDIACNGYPSRHPCAEPTPVST